MALRAKTGGEIWTDFSRKLDGILPKGSEFLLSPVLPLFREALVSFDAGANGVAVLGCRASVESACYLFLTRRRATSGWRSATPAYLDGGTRKVYSDELIRGAEALRGLTHDLRIQADRIQSHGNFLSHLASRKDIDQRRAVVESMDIFFKSGQFPNVSVRTGITRVEAQADLESTASILVALETEHPKLPSFGPDPWDYGQD
jgi:hypothetical protein